MSKAKKGKPLLTIHWRGLSTWETIAVIVGLIAIAAAVAMLQAYARLGS